ncbi:hypothetical protein SCRM01_210 [Synechococcus phage S-CRM01]|uniref:hypothetical protein n=1 Tax=Synechococcus phage S-CRM01 TaxID=1026955 RepID=UPI000209E423|nr:hypothetical protein SCRM01_210 [Synechococcus phage S-CRM01]AEC53156.1 hypothetical protein SCRM01_210 [Synechococcus phage S-CRM01]
MLPDLAFKYKIHAERYIDSQPGIMGRTAEWSKEVYGDWTIKTVDILDFDVVEAGVEKVRTKLRAQEKFEYFLSTLTDEEIEFLEL